MRNRNIPAALAGAATGIFIIGFAAGVVTDAYFTPDEIEIIGNTTPPEYLYCEEQENEQIEDALFARSIDCGEFEATAYCNCEKCCGEWAKYHSTYTGAEPVEGVTIAVDPDVIPLNSQVFVTFDDGTSNCYTAQDIGGAIKGNRMDIYFESHDDALRFGRQTVNVSYAEN